MIICSFFALFHTITKLPKKGESSYAIEPRTNGLRVWYRPFIHAGYTVCVYQDVATAEKFVFLGVLGSNDVGF